MYTTTQLIVPCQQKFSSDLTNYPVRSSRIGFNYSASGTDKRGVNGVGGIGSDCESDEGEEGDYTVYECPGLAPVGGIWLFSCAHCILQRRDCRMKAYVTTKKKIPS